MDWISVINYPTYLLTFIAIYGCIAIGLNIQWGYAGLFNAGIGGFFAIGAYVSAILTSAPVEGRLGGFSLPVPIGMAAAMALSGLVAWPVGKICLRFRSDYLAMVTIGFAEAVRLTAQSEEWLTNGSRGINGLPRPFSDLPYAQSQFAYLLIVIAVLIAIYVAVERQAKAPWGRMMRAIRDNEVAASAMGKNIAHRRMEAFIFGAALMGLGGALYVHFVRGITPDALDPFLVTFLVWVMVILGGSGNNRGALLGVLIVWTIWSVSEIATDQLPEAYALKAKYARMFLIGFMLLMVLRFRPEGLLSEPLYSIRKKGRETRDVTKTLMTNDDEVLSIKSTEK